MIDSAAAMSTSRPFPEEFLQGARKRFRLVLLCTTSRRWQRGGGSALGAPRDRCGAGRQRISALLIAADGTEKPIPLDHALVRALACEAVAQTELPLSRQSLADPTSRVNKELGESMSRSTFGVCCTRTV